MKKSNKLSGGIKYAAVLGCIVLAAVSFGISGCGKADDGGSKADDGYGITDDGGTEEASSGQNEARPVYGQPGEVGVYDETACHYTLSVDGAKPAHEISDMLFGIFFEDINFAADGGLYAEMVCNRSFEFTQLAAGSEKHAWRDVCENKDDMDATVVAGDKEGGLNCNNTNYMVLTNYTDDALIGIANQGFLDGMSVEEGAQYRCSVWAKGLDGYDGQLNLMITENGESIGGAVIGHITGQWQRYEVMIEPVRTAFENVELQVTIAPGSVAVDMVSLMPADTFRGRENGLRRDLAEKLEALEPAFLRFPGGCVVEGVTLDGAYDWKDSIGVDENREPLLFNGSYGDVAARKQGQNIWTNENTSNDRYPSFMSYGLGFYEYFLLAEDIGAVGVPVINCGMCCMGQSDGSGHPVGSEQFETYIEDALDLVEFCRGDENTTWGAVRIAMGHEEPFALKYIGIGNEQWGQAFYAHYTAFVEAFAKAREENPEMYGDIGLMFTAGVDDGDSGADYAKAYEFAQGWLAENPDYTLAEFAGAVDHHYYNSPDWFLEHADYYDETNYSRDALTGTRFCGAIPVFLGEYAAQSNTWRAGLAEAAYMTGLERNGDIVRMAAYAPLFGNTTAMHWAPDLIWFNNHTVTCSVNYYVQQIFARNVGTELLTSTLTGADIEDKPLAGRVGVGTWNTSAVFDNLTVTDNETGEVLAGETFDGDSFEENWEKISDGIWSVKDGALYQDSRTTNTLAYGNTGTAAYFGETAWQNYTLTLEATKTGGSEGFLIPFAVGNKDNHYFWNIGGWNNTVSCLQQVKEGGKSGQLGGTTTEFAAVTGQTYRLKLVVTDWNVKCYIDDVLYVDYDVYATSNAEAYQVVSTDESGDIIIKLVNVTGQTATVAISLEGVTVSGDTAVRETVAGAGYGDDNILGKEEVVTLTGDTVSGVGGRFNYSMPPYSVTVLRIPTK